MEKTTHHEKWYRKYAADHSSEGQHFAYTDRMLDRKACERRVYRLATLLTGNPIAAARVIAQVVDAQPDLRNLDSAHMDRLTVLRSREINPSTLVDDRVPAAVSTALASLTLQQREAWIFSRVYQVEPREMAKAMDCSVTATQRHIDQAEIAMRSKLSDPTHATTAARSLRDYSMTIDVPQFYRKRQHLRKMTKRLLLLLIAIVAITVIVAAWWWIKAIVTQEATAAALLPNQLGVAHG